MFDDIDRLTPEYRLSRVLSQGFGRSRAAGVRREITAAGERLRVYERERHAHKNENGPAPRLSLLREALERIAEAGRMMRSIRESRSGYTLSVHQGIDLPFVFDELWQASDAIWRWIEYERTRWSDQ